MRKELKLSSVFEEIKERKKTFALFGFKTQEKYENLYVKPVIKEFTKG